MFLMNEIDPQNMFLMNKIDYFKYFIFYNNNVTANLNYLHIKKLLVSLFKIQ
jgi:hypothetical protein